MRKRRATDATSVGSAFARRKEIAIIAIVIVFDRYRRRFSAIRLPLAIAQIVTSADPNGTLSDKSVRAIRRRAQEARVNRDAYTLRNAADSQTSSQP